MFFFQDLKNAMTSYSSKYYSKQSRASWKPIVSTEDPTPIEIADMALRRLEKSSLVFMTQSKAFVDTNIINKVRLNTVEGWQVSLLVVEIRGGLGIDKNPSCYCWR